jgi:hypothetical protein
VGVAIFVVGFSLVLKVGESLPWIQDNSPLIEPRKARIFVSGRVHKDQVYSSVVLNLCP